MCFCAYVSVHACVMHVEPEGQSLAVSLNCPLADIFEAGPLRESELPDFAGRPVSSGEVSASVPQELGLENHTFIPWFLWASFGSELSCQA